MAGLPYQSIDSAVASASRAVRIGVDGIYLNPFLPFSWTRFRREGNIYSSGQANSKNRTVDIIDKLLDKMHYRRTSAGYRKVWTAQDQERAYQMQRADNLLSFGHGAFSHAAASLEYGQFICGSKKIYNETLPEMFNAKLPQRSLFQYCGFEMDMNREMHVFAFTHLFNFSLAVFKKRFKKDFRQVFKKQLDFLKFNNLLAIEDERVIFSTQDLFMRRFIQSFFLDADYIEKMKKFTGEKYDPGKDYRSCALAFTQ
jgi:coproporphyrinogen III oxidase-like Fe-S oxidoreductase